MEKSDNTSGQKTWETYKKKYHRLTINLSDDDDEILSKRAKALNRKKSSIAHAMVVRLLHEEDTFFMPSKDEAILKNKQIKEAFHIFRGLANNINQIARGLNERRLINPLKATLKPSEKKEILDTLEALEKAVLDFIDHR